MPSAPPKGRRAQLPGRVVSHLHGEYGDDETQRDWTRLVGVAMKIILTIDIKDGPDTIIELTKILQGVGADTSIQIEPSKPPPILIELSKPPPRR